MPLDPVRAVLREYVRPWKLVTFILGLSVLIAGSFYYEAPDWDVPISIIMAALAYLSAPWCLRVVLQRQWRLLPVALLATWFTVDGCYAVYWHYKNPLVLELMREANLPASLSLFGMCGVLWLYNGSLSQLLAQWRLLLRRFHSK